MKSCINCKFELEENSHYCPNCGQKVDGNNLAVKAVTKEFFENYIALDTRFGRSIKPFLLKPGFLALQFIDGKRVSFANPFRLYIITSIFFFFCLTNYINHRDDLHSKPIIEIGTTQLHPFSDLSKEEIKLLNKELNEKTIQNLNRNKDTSFVFAYSTLKPLRKKNIIKALDISSLERLGVTADTSLLNKATSFYFNTEKNSKTINWDFNTEDIQPYLKDDNYTNQMIYDSLIQGKDVSFIQELFFKQSIKFARASESEIRRTIFGNLSLGMFVLIPLFSLFLKLFYFRKNKFYVAHLIHTIYIQSFAFLLFGLILFIGIYIPFFESSIANMIVVASLLFAYYFIKSLRIVYQQSRLLTILKSSLLFGIYFFLAIFSIVGEMLFSFLIF